VKRSPPPSVKATAIRMLARREYSRAELSHHLLQRGAERAEVERVLAELEQLGYLSDARFASAVVHQKAGRYAKRAIAHELKEKGVAKPAAQEALGALDHVDELADATALWRRRFGLAPRDDREKARQLRFLLARGYTAAIAFQVLRAAGASVNEDA
jgi:regulatory protein